MWLKYPGTKLIGTSFKKGRRMKNSPSCAHVRNGSELALKRPVVLVKCKGQTEALNQYFKRKEKETYFS